MVRNTPREKLNFNRRREETIENEQEEHKEAGWQYELEEALKNDKYSDDDIEKIEACVNNLNPESVKKALNDSEVLKNNGDSNKVFERIFEKAPRLVKENIESFQGLTHITLNTLLSERGKSAAEAGIGAPGVFDVEEIQSVIHQDFENNFDAYDDKGRGYDYKKAVDDLKEIGIKDIFSKDGFVISKGQGSEEVLKKTFSEKEMLVLLERGDAEWIRDNQGLFNVEEVKKSILDRKNDKDIAQFPWEGAVKAGFVDEVLDALSVAKQKSISSEVFQEITEERPTKERVEGTLKIISKFNIDENKAAEEAIEWVVGLGKPQQVETIIKHIKEMPGVNHSSIAEKCIDKELTKYVAENLGEFEGLHKKVFEDLVEEGYISEIIKRENRLNTIFEKNIHEEVVRRIYTESVYNIQKIKKGLKESIDDALRENPRLRENKESVEKIFGVNSGDIEKVQNYIRTKKMINDATEERAEAIEGVKNTDDAKNIAEKMIEIEDMGAIEEVRLKERTEGWSEKALSKLKKGWKWLGDVNMAKVFDKESKSRLWTGVGRALSLRTALLAALVPISGVLAGGSGIAAALGLRKGIRALSGANAGHALAKGVMERNIQKRMREVDEKSDLDYVINTKKERDEFTKEYYTTAEEIERAKSGQEYQEFLEIYKEKIVEFCKDADKKEEKTLREKLDKAEVGARKKIKKDKWKLWAAAGAGGVATSFTSEIWNAVPGNDLVEEKVGGWFGHNNDTSTGRYRELEGGGYGDIRSRRGLVDRVKGWFDGGEKPSVPGTTPNPTIPETSPLTTAGGSGDGSMMSGGNPNVEGSGAAKAGTPTPPPAPEIPLTATEPGAEQSTTTDVSEAEQQGGLDEGSEDDGEPEPVQTDNVDQTPTNEQAEAGGTTEVQFSVDEPYAIEDNKDVTDLMKHIEEMGSEDMKISEEFKNFMKTLELGEEVVVSGEGENMTIEIHDPKGNLGGPPEQISIFEQIIEGEHILGGDSRSLSEVIGDYSEGNKSMRLQIEGGEEVSIEDIERFRPDALKDEFPQGTIVEVEEGEKILIKNGNPIDYKNFDANNINTDAIGQEIEGGEFNIKVGNIGKELHGLQETAGWADGDSPVKRLEKRMHVERFIDALTFDVVGGDVEIEKLESAREKMVNILFEDNCEGLEKLVSAQESLDKKEFIQLSYSAEDESMTFEKYLHKEVRTGRGKRISRGLRDIISTEPE